MMRELEILREGWRTRLEKMAEDEKVDHGPDEVAGESKGGVTATLALETDEQTRPGSPRKLGRPNREPRTLVMGSRGEKTVRNEVAIGRDGNMQGNV